MFPSSPYRPLRLVALPLLAGLCILSCGDDPVTPGGGNGGAGAPGPPTNFEIFGYQDNAIMLRWEPPVLGNTAVQGYKVYGSAYASGTTKLLDNTTNTSIIHDSFDQDRNDHSTFSYYVKAYNDNGESAATEVLSTIPIKTTGIIIYERHLDSASNLDQESGVVFDRDTHFGSAYEESVPLMSFPRDVDFYLTDFEPGCCGADFHFCSIAHGSYASPDSSSIADFGGALNDCEFWFSTNPTAFPVAVDSRSQSAYVKSLPVQEGYFSIYTFDHHYAVMKVKGPVDTASGYVELEFWFQPITDFVVFGQP
jgi:hypothetical protein